MVVFLVPDAKDPLTSRVQLELSKKEAEKIIGEIYMLKNMLKHLYSDCCPEINNLEDRLWSVFK